MEKYNDFRVAKETIAAISERLSYSFLLNSAIRRDAERVTAEEIRYMAQELESSLGGVYSLLSTSFQLPLVRILLEKLEAKGELPPLPESVVRPQIVTGLDGLGRSDDLNRLSEFLQDIQMLSQAQGVQGEMHMGEIIKRLGAARGIETHGLLKSDEEKQAEQEAQEAKMKEAQFMELLKTASPEIVKQFGPMLMGGEGMGAQPQTQLPS
jgi:hypothetical protein